MSGTCFSFQHRILAGLEGNKSLVAVAFQPAEEYGQLHLGGGADRDGSDELYLRGLSGIPPGTSLASPAVE